MINTDLEERIEKTEELFKILMAPSSFERLVIDNQVSIMRGIVELHDRMDRKERIKESKRQSKESRDMFDFGPM